MTYEELWANEHTTETREENYQEGGAQLSYRRGKEDRNKPHMGNMKTVDLDKSPFRKQGEIINPTVVGEQEDKREGMGERNRALVEWKGGELHVCFYLG